MKERPILFSAPMVCAILNGSKTQTRRIYKNRKHPDTGCDMGGAELVREPQHVIDRICPYGQAGDRLWVKETWSEVGTMDPGLVVYRAAYPASVLPNYQNVPPAADIKWKPSLFMRRTASRILLEIVDVRMERLQEISQADSSAEGISVWAESEQHGTRWGCPPHVRRFGEGDNVEDAGFGGRLVKDPREAFRGVWSAIHGPGSWEANPWVWVVEFRRVA